MFEPIGKVLAVNDAGVEVCARKTAGCRLCEQGKGCGGGLLGRLLNPDQTTVVATSGPAPLSVGQMVRLELPDRSLLKASAVAFALPLCGMFASMAMLFGLGLSHDRWLVPGALIGLAAGAFGARRWLAVRAPGDLIPVAHPVTSVHPDFSQDP